MFKKPPWYYNANIVSIVAFYLEPKEILKAKIVCKGLYKHLDTNKIWWYLYNKAFNEIRTLDNASLLAAHEGLCPAKEAFILMKKAALENYKVSPENVYRAWLFGRIGPLPKSETLASEFGDKYDLLASFSAKFILENKPCQISNISIPALDRLHPFDAVVIMINPDDKNSGNIAQNAIKYMDEKKPKNVMLLVNASKDYETRYEKCPLLQKVEDLIGQPRTYAISIFSEETLATVAHMMILLAKEARKKGV